VLLEILSTAGDDKLIPHIVWQNLHPLVEDQAGEILDTLARTGVSRSPAVQAAMPRLVERLLARKDPSPEPVVRLIGLLASGPQADPATAKACLGLLAQRVQTREISGDRLAGLKTRLEPIVAPILAGPADQPLYFEAAVLATALGNPVGSDTVRKIYLSSSEPAGRRLQSLEALVAAHDPQIHGAVAGVLADSKESIDLRGQTLGMLGRSDEPWVSAVVLAGYGHFEPELQPKAIDLLTQRPEWAYALLDAIGRREIPASALGVNQVRKLLASKDNTLVEKVTAQWGTLRADRNPQREQVIVEIRQLLSARAGDPQAGQVVFNRVCGQCHKIYGVGQEVGPDLTSNGRSSLDQLLSNVLDPSLVIGAGYLARTVVTDDGRVLTGLPVEDNDQRLVLKIQGGKLETIARGAVEEVRVSQLSLMPEELEKQIKPEEMVDLFAFLALDKPPSDPSARQLPGLPAPAAGK
jgi:putative heme-binding domain-containing protein